MVTAPAAQSAPVTVQQPAGLSATASVTPPSVSAGLQQLQFALNASNTGEAGLTFSALGAPAVTPTGTAAATLVSSPPSPAGSTLAGGSQRSFTWTYNVTGSGSLTFAASVGGTDANAAMPVSAGPATAGPATVQKPANLTVTSVVATPSLVQVGGAIDVAVTVQNSGEAAALNVQPSGVSGSATAAVSGTGPAGAVGIPHTAR